MESADFIIQCKKVKTLSLAELTKLTEEIAAWAETKRVGSDGRCWSTKVGMVAVQLANTGNERRQGEDGKKEAQPILYVFTETQLNKLFKKMNFDQGGLHETNPTP